ncbi:MAG: class II fructose-bisphosphatase [Tissierellia bacterium]|nr:class II fructose-bisphosphatase [Tissierellia bacterium]
MDRNLAVNLGRVTEAAALASGKHLGRGDKNGADQAAVDAMRRMFDTVDIDGIVVIGEGEMDEAPMLYIGEHIGTKEEGGAKVDIAVDPLDGTTSIANGLPNAISVVAVTPRGCMLHAPDMYMEKIACGPKAAGMIDIKASPEENIIRVAKALGKDVTDITVAVLDRERHVDLVNAIRNAGARIQMISDGDVMSALATCFDHTGVDLMMGIGGAPEGVLAAAALKCMRGDFQCILKPEDDEQIARCQLMGASLDRVYRLDDLVQGDDILFAATGVSNGELLKGVQYLGNNKAQTETLILRSATGTVRFMEATHYLDRKPEYAK